MNNTQPGTVTLETDGVKLDFTRHLSNSPREVWEALTSPEAFGAWYNATAEIDPREGGAFTVHSGPFVWTGKILEWNPEKEFKYEHNHTPNDDMPNGASTVVTWTLTPQDGGTDLRFTQTGLPSSVGFAPGTHVVIDRLVAYVAGEEMPDFNGFYGEVESLYPELNAEK
jgi:uncharacterized protein YndB with AHSA1/START domain